MKFRFHGIQILTLKLMNFATQLRRNKANNQQYDSTHNHFNIHFELIEILELTKRHTIVEENIKHVTDFLLLWV